MSKIKRTRELLDSFIIATAPLTRWTTVVFHWSFREEWIMHTDHRFQRGKTELKLEVGERHEWNKRHGGMLLITTSVQDIDIQSRLCS